MEKAIEIKRRAQRCILNGDLDGALSEYEKLIASGDSDPYHSVLLADLLFKKGDYEGAASRYLDSVTGYEKVGLVKNAIAVCKKMSRLSLSPGAVLQRLGSLHALDGLSTESSLYYMQHAELLIGEGKRTDAEKALRQAFTVCPDNVRALELLAELQEQSGSDAAAAVTLLEAATHHERHGHLAEAKRCRTKAQELDPDAGSASAEDGAAARGTAAPARSEPAAPASRAAETESSSLSFDSGWVGRGAPPPAPAPATGPAAAEEDEDVYEIGATPDYSAIVESPSLKDDADEADANVYSIDESNAPSLDFNRPSAAAHSDEPSVHGLPEVSVLLNEAQALFKSGDREAASSTLVRAAQAYDHLERFDSAASIYRSLSQVNEAPLQVMMLWLKNCQRRNDLHEAAFVACELGDRALLDSDIAGAREWFERAKGLDPSSEVATRRLQRMAASAAASAAPVADTPPVAESLAASAPVAEPEPVATATPVAEPEPVATATPVAEPEPITPPPAPEPLVLEPMFPEPLVLEPMIPETMIPEPVVVDSSPVAPIAPPLEVVAAPPPAPIAAPAEPRMPEPAIASAAPPAPVTVPASPGSAPSQIRVTGKPGTLEIAVETEEPVGHDLGTLIADFQRGLEEQLDSDPQGHYDLGMSYREMGLYEHAILSFKTAAEAPAFRVRGSEMVGRCLLDQGDFDGAVVELSRTLELPDLAVASAQDIRYQLGLALEAGGRLEEALTQFEQVYAGEPNYPDVASKIRALRKTLEKE